MYRTPFQLKESRKIVLKRVRRNRIYSLLAFLAMVITYAVFILILVHSSPSTFVYYSVSQDQCIKVIRDGQECDCDTIDNNELYETIYVE